MNTMTNYDSIDKALNTSSAIDVTPTSKPQKVESTKDDVKKDYDYTRANLYSLVEKGQEALNGILEVAGEGGSAREGRDFIVCQSIVQWHIGHASPRAGKQTQWSAQITHVELGHATGSLRPDGSGTQSGSLE